MGVKGLWKIVNTAGKAVTLEDLRGKTVAIDTSIWLTKYVSVYSNFTKQTNSGNALAKVGANTSTDLQKKVLSAFFKRICKLLYFNVKPVFVFDGATPELKSRTLELRRMHRATAVERRNAKNRQRLLQTFINKQLEAKEGRKSPKELKQTTVDAFVQRTKAKEKDSLADLQQFALSDSFDFTCNSSESESEFSSDSDSVLIGSDGSTTSERLGTRPKAETGGKANGSGSEKDSASELEMDADGFSKRHVSRVVRRELSKRERERELEIRALRHTGIEDAERLLSAARSGDNRVMVLVRTRRKSDASQEGQDSASDVVEVKSQSESQSDEVQIVEPEQTAKQASKGNTRRKQQQQQPGPSQSDAIVIPSDSESDGSTSTEGLVEVDTEFELATQRAIQLSLMEAAKPEKSIIALCGDASSPRRPASPLRSTPERKSSPVKSPLLSSPLLAAPTQTVSSEHGELERGLQTLLNAFGIPSVRARGEADVECALLSRFGLADGVVTEDGDCLLLGAHTVYRNLFDQNREPLRFDAAVIRKQCALSRARLVFYALLAGCDYSAGVRGCGASSALRLARFFVPMAATDQSDADFDVTDVLRDAASRLGDAFRNPEAAVAGAEQASNSREISSLLRKLAATHTVRDSLLNERALFALGDPLREAGERDFQEYVASRKATLRWSTPDLDALRRAGFALLSLPPATIDALALDTIRRVREFESQQVDSQPRITEFIVPSESAPSSSHSPSKEPLAQSSSSAERSTAKVSNKKTLRVRTRRGGTAAESELPDDEQPSNGRKKRPASAKSAAAVKREKKPRGTTNGSNETV